nr:unnamed protein product [Callosobruchus analis]
MSWHDHVATIATTASQKLGVLFRYRKLYTPEQLLLLYKAQIRPSLEYCSHVWGCAPKHSLKLLDSIQNRAVRLLLTKDLHSLEHRRRVAGLFLFYRFYHGRCSSELSQIITPKAVRTRNFREALHAHPYQAEVPTPRTSLLQHSFFWKTSTLWNELSGSRVGWEKDRSPAQTTTTASTGAQPNTPQQSQDKTVSELFKMSHSGYSAPVTSWNGTRSQLDREIHEERREERKRSLADSSHDQNLKAKHQKTNNYNNHYKSNPGYNPIQRTTIQLKRLWDKVKRSRKSQLAEERRELMATGGGPARPALAQNPSVDLLVPHIAFEIDVGDDSDGIQLNTVQAQSSLADEQPGPSTSTTIDQVMSVEEDMPSTSKLHTSVETPKSTKRVVRTGSSKKKYPAQGTELEQLTAARLLLIEQERRHENELHELRMEEAFYRKEAARLAMLQEEKKLEQLNKKL